MPRYDYSCSKCGVIEVFQPITEDHLKKCPECKSSKFKRLLSRSTFFLLGDGWTSGINGELYKSKVKEIETGLEKEERELRGKGLSVFPEGTSRAGDII